MFRDQRRIKQKLSHEECIELLKNEKRAVLSVLGDDDYPYGMPVNHFYNEEDGKIYIHGSKRGHKIDAIKRHDKVSLCVHDQGYQNEGEWAYQAAGAYTFPKGSILGGRYGTTVKLNFSHIHSVRKNNVGGSGTDGYGSPF